MKEITDIYKEFPNCNSYIRYGDCMFCEHYRPRQYAEGWMHVRYECRLGLDTSIIDNLLTDKQKERQSKNWFV